MKVLIFEFLLHNLIRKHGMGIKSLNYIERLVNARLITLSPSNRYSK